MRVQNKVDENLINILMSAAFSEDITLQSFENIAHSFLLARTLRSGELHGVETELAYLENAPGFIFINPTTLISKKIPSKTISQLPGNDWSDHPTLLFSVQTQSKATIAHYGLFSVNSFSSTDALSFLNRFARLEGKTNEKLSFTQKIEELAIFLQKNWKNTIHSVKENISLREGKMLEPPSVKDLRKKFYKPFTLYFHDKSNYSSLIFSFDEFIAELEQSNKLENTTLNVSLNPHPLARILEQHMVQHGKQAKPEFKKTLQNELLTEFQKKLTSSTEAKKNQAERDRAYKLKGLFFRAEGNLSKSTRNVIDNEEFDGRSIYERYCDYLDTGARHNELASRVYPWEITGIEWGSSDACKINAVANTIITIESKKKLFQELEEQNCTHPLFIDFILNKLSIENPTLSYDEINELFHLEQTEHPEYFSEILKEIKLQCLNSVCIYEYSPTKRELTNITAMVAKSQQTSFSRTQRSFWEDKSKHTLESSKVDEYIKIFKAGVNAYNEWLTDTIIIPPLSKIKKLNVRIKTLNLTGWAKFWERNTADIEMNEILHYLSVHIINQPYVDEKRELIDSNGYIVYRPNHDVTHSLRKLNYKEYLINLILESQQECWQNAIKEFTQEEMACMNFLIFLYRSGRTNEQGSSLDSDNVERSANVFELVSMQLGFNVQLVKSIKKCFNFIPIDAQMDAYFSEGYAGDAKLKIHKAYLMHRIANIIHDIDLVRCNSWRYFFENEEAFRKAKSLDPSIKNFQFDIFKQIKVFFPDIGKAEAVTNKLFFLAKKSCEASGTPVFYEGFSSSEKVSDYNEPLKDPTLINLFKDKFDPYLPLIDIKSFWTENVSQCLTLLHEVTHMVEEELDNSCVSNLSI